MNGSVSDENFEKRIGDYPVIRFDVFQGETQMRMEQMESEKRREQDRANHNEATLQTANRLQEEMLRELNYLRSKRTVNNLVVVLYEIIVQIWRKLQESQDRKPNLSSSLGTRHHRKAAISEPKKMVIYFRLASRKVGFSLRNPNSFVEGDVDVFFGNNLRNFDQFVNEIKSQVSLQEFDDVTEGAQRLRNSLAHSVPLEYSDKEFFFDKMTSVMTISAAKPHLSLFKIAKLLWETCERLHSSTIRNILNVNPNKPVFIQDDFF